MIYWLDGIESFMAIQRGVWEKMQLPEQIGLLSGTWARIHQQLDRELAKKDWEQVYRVDDVVPGSSPDEVRLRAAAYELVFFQGLIQLPPAPGHPSDVQVVYHDLSTATLPMRRLQYHEQRTWGAYDPRMKALYVVDDRLSRMQQRGGNDVAEIREAEGE